MKPLKILISFLVIIIILVYSYVQVKLKSYLKVKNIIVTSDIDKDGINDIDDILEGARNEVNNKTNYKSAYYTGGFPPENEGVCTDVIWRAFMNAGIDLKSLIDNDIKNNISKYKRVEGKPDPNIDFRRVPNLDVFMQRKTTSLTIEIIPGNIENLKHWQPGDIVTFDKPKNHTAIISNKRNKEGVPYIIHNSAPFPREDDWLVYWDENVSEIMGHYRWKY
ncbi:MAG: DUF1287 domain-containing protein [Candidatus Gracilibacteria bacterium]